MTKLMIMIWAVAAISSMQAQSPKDFDLTGYDRAGIMEKARDAHVERVNESPEDDMIGFVVDGVGVFFALFYEGLSLRSGFAPYGTEGMHKLISALNEEAVITGEDEWKIYYDSGHVTRVTLDYVGSDDESMWVFEFELIDVP